jgi:hypothetical protein
MKLYVSYGVHPDDNPNVDSDDPQAVERVIWTTSDSAASKACTELKRQGCERNTVDRKDIDVDTRKEPLVSFLNHLAATNGKVRMAKLRQMLLDGAPASGG